MIQRDRPELTCALRRRAFLSQVETEHCILLYSADTLSSPAIEHPAMSIKTLWGGKATFHFPDRRVTADEDGYLVVPAHRTYGASIASRAPVRCLEIFFRLGMPERVLASLAATSEPLEPEERAREFLGVPERLYLHDSRVSPVLRYIARFVEEGYRDEGWYEEQLVFLLERLFRAHEQAIGSVRPHSEHRATVRAELLRRIARARDFILSNYDQKLTLTGMADVAHLSKYHFARLFRDVQGMSPSEFLRRKRISVAIRLLRTTGLTVEGVAHRCGLADRSTLYRLCMEHRGQTPKRLRAGETARHAPLDLVASG